MSVAAEHMTAVIDAAQFRPNRGAFSRVEMPRSATSLRESIRTELAEALDIGPNESAMYLDTVGRTTAENEIDDVLIVDFDAVFEDTPERAAAELLQRSRPGGRIGLASPAPGSFLARIEQVIKLYSAPASAAPRSGFTGTRESLNELFGEHAAALGARDRSVALHYPSAEHWLAAWQSSYKPLQLAYRLIEPEWRGQFSEDLLRVATEFAEFDNAGMSIQCDYLEFLVHKSITQ